MLPQDSQVSLSTPCLFHTLDIYTEPGSLRVGPKGSPQATLPSLNVDLDLGHLGGYLEDLDPILAMLGVVVSTI